MPLVHIDHTGQATFILDSAGESGREACTLGFQSNETDAQAVADLCFSAWATTLQPGLSARCQLSEVHVIFRLAGNTESAIGTGAGAVIGGSGDGMLPSNCAILIQKKTQFAGRKNRGRMYLPGVPSAQYILTADQNTMREQDRVAWQDRCDAFYLALTAPADGDPVNPMILHPSPDNTTTQIVAFAVQARLATQRTRLRD